MKCNRHRNVMYNRNRNEVLNTYKWGVIARNLNEVLVLETRVIK